MACWRGLYNRRLNQYLTSEITRRHTVNLNSTLDDYNGNRVFFKYLQKRIPDSRVLGRSYAAPLHAKGPQVAKHMKGPLLNDQIKARFVRLIFDKCNTIVPLNEALRQAERLKLDLVEVQGNADPPVCKIMNFHREKYIKEMSQKNRAKSRSDVSIRNGDCKEVRFSEKIEDKDLKMKAESIKKLMERGYRVKCIAMGSGKGLEDEENEENRKQLAQLLSRLTALIEDVSVIESGPLVKRKQAYVIVRHEKFGPLKKGSPKKIRDPFDTDKTEACNTVPNGLWSMQEPDNNLDDVFDLQENGTRQPVGLAGQKRPGLGGLSRASIEVEAQNLSRNGYLRASNPSNGNGFSSPAWNDPAQKSINEENRYRAANWGDPVGR